MAVNGTNLNRAVYTLTFNDYGVLTSFQRGKIGNIAGATGNVSDVWVASNTNLTSC